MPHLSDGNLARRKELDDILPDKPFWQRLAANDGL